MAITSERARLVIAMKKAFTDAEYKEAVALVGPEQALEINLQPTLVGSLKTGVAQEQEFWQIGRPEVTLMRFMNAVNGATLNALTDEELDRIVAEQDAEAGEIEEGHAEEFKKFKDRVTAAFKRLRGPTKQPCNPKVLGKVTATLGGVDVQID